MSVNAHILDTLFSPVEAGVVVLSASHEALFLNAQYHPALSSTSAKVTCVQYFKPYADVLNARGFAVVQSVPQQKYDVVFVAVSKNQIQNMHDIALAFSYLKPGGLCITAGDNKAGGNRLKKIYAALGVMSAASDSMKKCKVVWATLDGFDHNAVQSAITTGQPRDMDHGFHTWPGIYGWDKIDKGSTLLLEHLPDSLKGQGADFGCGYGYLSRHVANIDAVDSLICADADWRALEVCKKNMQAFSNKLTIEWCDLTQAGYKGLDFIVMNPPFHEGQTSDPAIGNGFIQNAAKSLKPKGMLYMVANTHLPYEPVLKSEFRSIEKLFEGQGFKIYAAQK